ncbi:MAG: SDR family oxidoreductase [Candidatus Eremiobacteraeota bacterium]|nr:SDR family oxidoreductase [Candidatus Eremiobacteraeota bacterium]
MKLKNIAATALSLALSARRVRRQLRTYDLRGRVVAVTGGSRGLGLQLARELMRRGARVAICGRQTSSLDAARADLELLGEVLAVQCDVRVAEQASNFMRAVVDRFGALDVVINNAGTITVGPLDTMTIEDYREAMETHLWGPLNIVTAALPELRRARGRIVNIASIGGLVSVPHLLPYSVSKFALVGLSEGLGAELQQSGVRVITVCPGLMRTGSPKNAWFKGNRTGEHTWFHLADTLPLSSISAGKAARQTVDALVNGRRFVVLSAPARLAARFHGNFPGLTVSLLSLVARTLPKAKDGDTGRALGSQSESAITRSPLTTLGRKAEVDLNQSPSG